MDGWVIAGIAGVAAAVVFVGWAVGALRLEIGRLRQQLRERGTTEQETLIAGLKQELESERQKSEPLAVVPAPPNTFAWVSYYRKNEPEAFLWKKYPVQFYERSRHGYWHPVMSDPGKDPFTGLFTEADVLKDFSTRDSVTYGHVEITTAEGPRFDEVWDPGELERMRWPNGDGPFGAGPDTAQTTP